MSGDEWYRSSAWSPDDEALFEMKLSRARSASRAQYLRLKAAALAGSSDPAARSAARTLLGRVISSGDELEAVMAHHDLGRLLVEDGEPALARSAFESCIRAEDALAGSVRTGADLDLAELIVAQAWDDAHDEAFRLLDRAAADGLVFEVQRWRHAVARARLHARRGEHDLARQAAREALALREDTRPDVARHPTVGRIPDDRAAAAEMAGLL